METGCPRYIMVLNTMSRYFSTLQKELESYDAVLFEMVTSKESLENRRNLVATKRLKVKSSRSRSFNILGCIQRQMARFLSLDFQLDCMDYESEKWYHADLDFETFKLLQVRLFIFPILLLSTSNLFDMMNFCIFRFHHYMVLL